jgi:putative endonuclease
MQYYYVYITASLTRVLYIGITNSIERRIVEHKEKIHEGFTNQYNVNRLVYYEAFTDVRNAIAREKALKGWRREKKITLINSVNPAWKDISEEWYEEMKRGEQARESLQHKT